MKKRAQNFRGQTGTLYPELSGIMQDAIRANADSSYKNSPALTMAVKSATQWQHADPSHLLPIISTLYANYRQYGCGGIQIAVLVAVLTNDKAKMVKVFQKAFEV